MKCPNCGAEVFPDDRFCGECGQKLEGSAGGDHFRSDYEDSIYIHKVEREEDTRTGGDRASNSYLSDAIEMLKGSFIAPAKMISSKNYFPPAISAGVILTLILVFSVLSFIFARSATADISVLYGGLVVPVSFLVQLLIYTSLFFGIFYGILFLLNKLILQNSVPWQKALNDFVVSSVLVLSFYMVAIVLEMMRLYEIGAIFIFIGGLLFLFAPLYIFLSYTEDNNTKFDSFYSVVLYIVLSAVGYYMVIRIILAQMADSIWTDFNNIF